MITKDETLKSKLTWN